MFQVFDVVQLGKKLDEFDQTYVDQLEAFLRMLDERPPPGAPGVDLAKVQAVYHDFDGLQFLAVARETYLVMTEAWESRDVTIAEGLCSKALYEDLRRLISYDLKVGRYHVLPGVEIRDALIVLADVVDGVATLVVNLQLIGQEYFLDYDSGQIVKGDNEYRRWSENWTFERTPDTDATAEDRRHALLPGSRGGWDFAHHGWDAVAIARTGAADLL